MVVFAALIVAAPSGAGGAVLRVPHAALMRSCGYVTAHGGRLVKARAQRACRRVARSASSAQQPTSYQNPVSANSADPGALNNNNAGSDYYVYTTGTLFPIQRSTDLVTWTSVGTRLRSDPAGWYRTVTGTRGRRAPAGRPTGRVRGPVAPSCYYLYYTGLSAQFATNCVAVATSPTPGGPFTDHGPLSGGPSTAAAGRSGVVTTPATATSIPRRFLDSDGIRLPLRLDRLGMPRGQRACTSATSTAKPTISVIPLASGSARSVRRPPASVQRRSTVGAGTVGPGGRGPVDGVAQRHLLPLLLGRRIHRRLRDGLRHGCPRRSARRPRRPATRSARARARSQSRRWVHRDRPRRRGLDDVPRARGRIWPAAGIVPRPVIWRPDGTVTVSGPSLVRDLSPVGCRSPRPPGSATGPAGGGSEVQRGRSRLPGQPLAVGCSPAPGSVFPIGATTVTCTAVDSGGRVGSASFPVVVADTSPPVVSVPSEITALATRRTGVVVGYRAAAVDAVDGALPVRCAPPSGTRFALGATAVVCAATDRAGNTGTAGFAVNVPLVPQVSRLVGVPAGVRADGTDAGGRCRPATRANRHLRPCRRRVVVRVRFTLNVAAEMTGARRQPRQRRTDGRGSCRPPTRSNRHHRACTRLIPLPVRIVRTARPGPNEANLDARAGAEGLGPGTYQLSAVPAVSKPPTTTLQIKP